MLSDLFDEIRANEWSVNISQERDYTYHAAIVGNQGRNYTFGKGVTIFDAVRRAVKAARVDFPAEAFDIIGKKKKK